ncbi:MAG: PD-(D/E)XK nuclease family protein [Candidatus Paceibacterota bacterium]
MEEETKQSIGKLIEELTENSIEQTGSIEQKNEQPNTESIGSEVFIHITEIGKCGRKLQYTYLSNTTDFKIEKAPQHIRGLIGTTAHSAIEQLLTKGKVEDGSLKGLLKEHSDGIPETVFLEARDKATQHIVKARMWLDDTPMDFSKGILEKRFYFVYKGYTFSGQLDYFDDLKQVDWKTGKKKVSSDYITQLAGYEWLLSNNGLGSDRDWYLVFFGDEKPVSVKISGSDKEKGRRLFMENLDKTVEMLDKVKAGEILPCQSENMLCVYCAYRGSCNGI